MKYFYDGRDQLPEYAINSNEYSFFCLWYSTMMMQTIEDQRKLNCIKWHRLSLWLRLNPELLIVGIDWDLCICIYDGLHWNFKHSIPRWWWNIIHNSAIPKTSIKCQKYKHASLNIRTANINTIPTCNLVISLTFDWSELSPAQHTWCCITYTHFGI